MAVFQQKPVYVTVLEDPKTTMPAVFRPTSHFDLTPPEYFAVYNGSGVQLNPLQFAIGQQPSMHDKAGIKTMYAGQDVYAQFPYSSQEQYSMGISRIMQSQQLPAPAAMPTELPGLIEDVPSRQAKRQEVQEERPVGGVSAHLDYDMDDMSEFVALQALKIIQPGSTLNASFRKFVNQILSSTRLPSSTILLGLEYLNTRMKGLPNSHRSAGHVYRMLTIALLLSSKFLDDNTFQNKSWAEVTSLPVAELNNLEVEWLMDINWTLHVDPTGKKGFEIWRQTWEQWRDSKTRSNGNNDIVLAPINTQISHRNSVHFTPTQSAFPGLIGERLIQLPLPAAMQQQQQQQQVQQGASPTYWWPASADRSPPSAPETGPATPDFTFNNWTGVQYAAPALTPSHAAMRTLPPLNLYGNHQQQSVWPGSQCGCNQCGRSSDYFVQGFGQAVMG